MDYNILMQIGIAIATIIVGYTILKQKVVQHDENIKEMDSELKESFKKRDDEAKEDYSKLDKKIDVCFTKYDDTKKELTSFQMALDKKVTLKEVNEEFITRKELDLRLQLIETTTTNTNREVAKMEEQLKEVLHLLQDIKLNKKD